MTLNLVPQSAFAERAFTHNGPDTPGPLFYTGEGSLIKIKTFAPSYPLVLEQFGSGPKKVVLTFDDGPNPRHTPQILEILKKHKIKATFFSLGRNIAKYPSLTKKTYEEGHEIGNHTFTHPDVTRLNQKQLYDELRATQKLIQVTTGHSTRLFRPPYLNLSRPVTTQNAHQLWRAQNQGYLIVNATTDSVDWKRDGSEKITKRSVDSSKETIVLLMHDGDRNREQTIKALPGVIETYKKAGYEFVTLSEMVKRDRSFFMPRAAKAEVLTGLIFLATLRGIVVLKTALKVIIALIVFLNLFRIVAMSVLSLLQHRIKKGRRGPRDALYKPAVSVVVPAYNEESVIKECLLSVLNSNYPNFEVIVVDDGSTDDTASEVSSLSDPRIRLIQKPNEGKAAALNHGIRHSRSKIIVTADADTIFLPDTLKNLVAPFEDPRVGAVAGNILVGNRHNLLTVWQSIEYITSLNLDRRASELLNCITIVPGAAGAFRKIAIKKAGYFSGQTLAEDTDLTISVQRAGYRVIYEDKAHALTEAPVTLKDLFKQRVRWSYGIIQCFWKHKSILFSRRSGGLGLIGLPYLLFFGIIFPFVAIFVDLSILGVLFLGGDVTKIILYLSVFLALELVLGQLAFVLARQKKWPLWFVPLQRFFYRHLLNFIVIQAVIKLFWGNPARWNKIKRAERNDWKRSAWEYIPVGGEAGHSGPNPASRAPEHHQNGQGRETQDDLDLAWTIRR